jgi:transcriptional regulator with XRE-family HTH domain
MGIGYKIAWLVKAPRPPLSMSPAAQGRRLNALRIAMKWSQAELALRTGIDTTSINRYCKGERPINAKHAWRIANATGLTAGYILDGDLRGLTKAQLDWLPDA